MAGNNYTVQVNDGVTRLMLPGKGERYEGGDTIELSPRQFRQIGPARLALLTVTFDPTSGGDGGGVDPSQVVSPTQLTAALTPINAAIAALSGGGGTSETGIDGPALNDDPVSCPPAPTTLVRGRQYTLTSGANLYNLSREKSFWYSATDYDKHYPLSITVFEIVDNFDIKFVVPVLPLGVCGLALYARGASQSGSSTTFTLTD